jgi:hypothetical protein
MRHCRSWRAILVTVLALVPAIATHRAMAGCPSTACVRLRMAQTAVTGDDCLDAFFHPLGLSAGIGIFIPSLAAAPKDPPGYPGGGSGGSGGSPGGSQPPSNGVPEPASLISGALGASLLGLFGWRRRRYSWFPAQSTTP